MNGGKAAELTGPTIDPVAEAGLDEIAAAGSDAHLTYSDCADAYFRTRFTSICSST